MAQETALYRDDVEQVYVEPLPALWNKRSPRDVHGPPLPITCRLVSR